MIVIGVPPLCGPKVGATAHTPAAHGGGGGGGGGEAPELLAANATSPELPQYQPTATQVLAELQETPVSRTSPCAPLGKGTLWGVQLEPFQDSASCTSPP